MLTRTLSMMKDLPDILVVDIDESPALVKQYEIKAVPTLVLLDGLGNVKDKVVGMMTTDQIREFIG